MTITTKNLKTRKWQYGDGYAMIGRIEVLKSKVRIGVVHHCTHYNMDGTIDCEYFDPCDPKEKAVTVDFLIQRKVSLKECVDFLVRMQ